MDSRAGDGRLLPEAVLVFHENGESRAEILLCRIMCWYSEDSDSNERLERKRHSQRHRLIACDRLNGHAVRSASELGESTAQAVQDSQGKDSQQLLILSLCGGGSYSSRGLRLDGTAADVVGM